MLRTNLATRPFYNQRALRVLIGAVALVALVLSVYNFARIVSLTARNTELSGRASAAETRAGELAGESRRIRDELTRADVSSTAAAAQEANLLIDRRAFSWTALFNRFEETLPGDVRIMAVQPQVDKDGRFVLAINVTARSVEAVDTFITEMEKSGAFHKTLAVSEQLQQDDTFRSVLQTFYTPEAAVPAAASETDKTDAANAVTPAADAAAAKQGAR